MGYFNLVSAISPHRFNGDAAQKKCSARHHPRFDPSVHVRVALAKYWRGLSMVDKFLVSIVRQNVDS